MNNLLTSTAHCNELCPLHAHLRPKVTARWPGVTMRAAAATPTGRLGLGLASCRSRSVPPYKLCG